MTLQTVIPLVLSYRPEVRAPVRVILFILALPPQHISAAGH